MIRAVLVLLLFGLAMSAPTYAGNPTHREGVISHMGPGFADDYLAIPLHTKGSLYRVCAKRCVTLRQNDYGPNQRIHPDRIADVSVSTFEWICNCDASRGVVRGEWTLVTVDELPATDTEVVAR